MIPPASHPNHHIPSTITPPHTSSTPISHQDIRPYSQPRHQIRKARHQPTSRYGWPLNASKSGASHPTLQEGHHELYRPNCRLHNNSLVDQTNMQNKSSSPATSDCLPLAAKSNATPTLQIFPRQRQRGKQQIKKPLRVSQRILIHQATSAICHHHTSTTSAVHAMSVVRARHHPLPCQHHHQFLSRQQQYFPASFHRAI